MERVRTSGVKHQPPASSPIPSDGTLAPDCVALGGARYARSSGTPCLARWGTQRGSGYLANQKMPVSVPRVRDLQAGVKVPLTTYAQWQAPRARDAGLFARVLGGLSSRDDHAAAEAIPKAFGLADSSVSRRFVHARARFSSCRSGGLMIASGSCCCSMGSRSRPTNWWWRAASPRRARSGSSDSNKPRQRARLCARHSYSDLEVRGFVAPHGLLVVFDGAKGLRAAVRDVDGPDVAVQRCQWHKRENVVGYLR